MRGSALSTLASILTVLGLGAVFWLSRPDPSYTAGTEANPAAAVQEPRPAAAVQKEDQVEYPVLAATLASPTENQSDLPAIACTSSGRTWIAWVEWNGKDGDRIAVRDLGWPAERSSVYLATSGTSHFSPALAARGDRILCAWSALVREDWELFAAWIDRDGVAGAPRQLTEKPGSDFNSRLVAAPDGVITLAWQGFRSGKSDIFARQLEGERWGDEMRISPGAANDWDPALACDDEGRVHAVWDSYETGDYNVYARRIEKGKLGPLVTIANSSRAEFHATAACDARGRLWVAYDTASENWGKDFSPGSGAAAPGSAGLHDSRQIEIRILTPQGLQQPASDPGSILKGRMARYAELPVLGFDANTNPWLIFRHWTHPAPMEIYHFYATRLGASGWSTPVQLAHSSGRNTQHAALARAAGGLLQAVYAGDGRSREVRPSSTEKSLTYRVYVARLDNAPASGEIELRKAQTGPDRPPAPPRERYATTINGRRYFLLFGDLHRHTDIRGHSGVDGSVLDSYRYALDAAELDFMGTTDHNQVTGGRWPDGLRDYQWWWTQKVADLFSNPPSFNGMYAYEHSLATPSGHRNIVFLRRGAPLRLADRERAKNDNLPLVLWEWMRAFLRGETEQKAVIIPHTFAEARQPIGNWEWENPEFEPVLEIYQGARSSYESADAAPGEKRGRSQLQAPGHFAQDALNRGYRYGFIASSDHGSTHSSYACVYAREATRAGIIEAMLARRTYASSDDVILDATLDDHAMGEDFELSGTPTLKIFARGRDELVRIDVIRDGRVIYNASGQGREFRGVYRDTEATAGRHYYYVRVIQRDPEKQDGDPEMAWGSPWFVGIR